MQSRTHSLIEQLLNTASGFLISVLVWQFVVAPIWHITTTVGENLEITLLFTVVSIARSYAWRRLFNRMSNKNKKKRHDETDRANRPS